MVPPLLIPNTPHETLAHVVLHVTGEHTCCYHRCSSPLHVVLVNSRNATVYFRRIRLRCNGWNKGDILKIFVRPGDGGRINCCDLAIDLVGKPSSSAASPPYGLLWADPARVEGSFEGKDSWQEEDVSHRCCVEKWSVVWWYTTKLGSLARR